MLFAALPVDNPSTLPTAVGPKARMIAIAMQRRIPVPPFWLLPEERLTQLLQAGLITQDDGHIHVPDAQQLHAAIIPGRLPATVAIRSAFSAEDSAHESLAGRFESVLAVPSGQPQAVADALCRVWSSAARTPHLARRDLMLMQMVDARHAGVAFLEQDYSFEDLVNATEGLGHRMVSGDYDAQRIELPRLGRDALANRLPPWQRRLQRLLRAVRRVFGDFDWDVEWADDGKVCWLLQVRPVTRPTVRNDFFTMANHREILPDPPSMFMTSLIGGCAASLFSYYRQFDGRLPRNRQFIEVMHGRPLINLSLLLDMMRLWGLPSRLVTDSIGGAASHPAVPSFGIHPFRLLRSLPILLRQWNDQRRAPNRARAVAGRLRQRMLSSMDQTKRSDVSEPFRHLTTAAGEVYTSLVREMFALTAAIGGPSAILRRLGLLHAFSHGGRTHATEMFLSLTDVAATIDHTPGARQQLQQGELPAADPFATAMRLWIKTNGMRGRYESDLAMPRFREQWQSLIPALLAPASPLAASPPLPWFARPLKPIWKQASRAIHAREELRHRVMDCFAILRHCLLVRALQCEGSGLLPGRDHLWQLTVEECCQLDAGWTPDDAFWQQRAQDEQQRRSITVPDVIRRFDPLPELSSATSQATASWTGIGLTRGDITGSAWVLHEPASQLPEGFQPHSTILVARSIDAGWVPTFRLVAGVAVEIGGDLSHGSIILRELGIPAVTNLSGITAAFHTGTPIRLQAAEGRASRPDTSSRPVPPRA